MIILIHAFIGRSWVLHGECDALLPVLSRVKRLLGTEAGLLMLPISKPYLGNYCKAQVFCTIHIALFFFFIIVDIKTSVTCSKGWLVRPSMRRGGTNDYTNPNEQKAEVTSKKGKPIVEGGRIGPWRRGGALFSLSRIGGGSLC